MTKIIEYIFNRFPQGMTVKSDKKIGHLREIGAKITSPENRLIMGVTALASQPFLDLYNKDVDEKTRIVSCAKTIAKIAVGTTVGVIVRKSSIGLAKKWCRIPDSSNTLSKMATIFTPKGIDFVKEKKLIDRHSNTMGTVLGTSVGLVTNFVIDMPLTKILTNVLINRFEGKKTNTNSEGGK